MQICYSANSLLFMNYYYFFVYIIFAILVVSYISVIYRIKSVSHVHMEYDFHALLKVLNKIEIKIK